MNDLCVMILFEPAPTRQDTIPLNGTLSHSAGAGIGMTISDTPENIRNCRHFEFHEGWHTIADRRLRSASSLVANRAAATPAEPACGQTRNSTLLSKLPCGHAGRHWAASTHHDAFCGKLTELGALHGAGLLPVLLCGGMWNSERGSSCGLASESETRHDAN